MISIDNRHLSWMCFSQFLLLDGLFAEEVVVPAVDHRVDEDLGDEAVVALAVEEVAAVVDEEPDGVAAVGVAEADVEAE